MLMRTKKKAGITAGILAVAVLISAVFCLCFKTEQIDIEQIRSISVRLPDDVEILLSAEEAEQVKGSLAKVELRGIATGLFKISLGELICSTTFTFMMVQRCILGNFGRIM